MFKKVKKLFKKKLFHHTEVFKSYDDVENFLKQKDHKEYNDERVYQKLLLPNDVEPYVRSVGDFAAPAIIIPLLNKKKIKVLDIGGGNDPIYNPIKKATNISTYCTVLESKKFLESIKWKISKNLKKYLKYISSLNQLKHNVDIVYFNSSIQYFKDYEDIVLKCIKFKPNFFFLTRSFFHNKNKNLFSVEHTVPNSTHPVILFSAKKLIKFFEKNKYKLIFQNEYNRNVFLHNVLDKHFLFMKDLVFEKRRK